MWSKSSVGKEKPIIFKWKKNLKRFKFVQFYQQKKKKSYNSNRPQKTKNSVAFLVKLCNYKQTIKKRKIPHEPDSLQYWTVRVSLIHINRKFGSTKTPKFLSKRKHSKLCGEKEINCTKIANAFRRLNSAIIIIASKKRSDINKEFLPSVCVYIFFLFYVLSRYLLSLFSSVDTFLHQNSTQELSQTMHSYFYTVQVCWCE